jgi:phospholipase/carboxylesterase
MPRTPRSTEEYCFSSPGLDNTFSLESAAISHRRLDFPHALFAPQHYEPGYAYPLLVWLHGGGDDQRQLQRIMPLVSMRNYVAAAPQGLPLLQAVLKNPALPLFYGWQQTDEHIQAAQQRVFDCVELAARKYHVNPQRVFLAGFDDGGTMALRVALANPQRFAGAISLCGGLPSGHSPLGNLLAARKLGIFLAAGRSSRKYPAEAVCDDLRLLHSAGLSVTLRQYPCGHEIMPQMLSDLDRWIIEQIAPSRPAGVESEAGVDI